MFLIVIASILFSWQEAYEMYYLQCQEDEKDVSQMVTANPSRVSASMVSLDQ